MAKRPKSPIPRYKRKKQRSFPRRIIGWIVKLVVLLFLITVLWVLAYRFVNPPITNTMIGDMIAGRGASKDWMRQARCARRSLIPPASWSIATRAPAPAS